MFLRQDDGNTQRLLPLLLWTAPPLPRRWKKDPFLWIKGLRGNPLLHLITLTLLFDTDFSLHYSFPRYYQHLAGVLDAGARSGRHHYICIKLQ